MRKKEVLEQLAGMEDVVGILYSQVHQALDLKQKCGMQPHVHWLIKLNRQLRKSSFPVVLQKHHWIRLLVIPPGCTLKEALMRYIKYIKAKGKDWGQAGTPLIKENDLNPVIRKKLNLFLRK